MNRVELNSVVSFGKNRMKITLVSDFFENCLTPEPRPHFHPKYELQYIARGTCVLQTEQGKLTCPQGSFLLLPPYCRHIILPAGNEEKTFTLTYAIEYEEESDAICKILALREPKQIPDTFCGGQRLDRIRIALISRDFAYAEKIQGELMVLMADLAAAMAMGQDAAPSTAAEENQVEIIESYFNHRCLDPDASSEALAKELHLSTRQMQRLCRKYFQMSYRELLTQTRLNIATQRLRTTDIPITELAQQLGYASVASFSAAYKRHFGYPPTRERI